MSDGIPQFWDLLELFWDTNRVAKWKGKLFQDAQNPDVGTEGCFNLISLAPHAHEMWTQGLFALKPLELSYDHKKLTIQFFWQVPTGHKNKSRIDLLTETASPEGLDFVGEGIFLNRCENSASTPRIYSGEVFTLTTDDPEKRPLPSVELLEMQWFLQRLVGMCGAAGWPSLDWDDDDSIEDNDGWCITDYIDSNVQNDPVPRRSFPEHV